MDFHPILIKFIQRWIYLSRFLIKIQSDYKISQKYNPKLFQLPKLTKKGGNFLFNCTFASNLCLKSFTDKFKETISMKVTGKVQS